METVKSINNSLNFKGFVELARLRRDFDRREKRNSERQSRQLWPNHGKKVAELKSKRLETFCNLWGNDPASG